jgi:TPR repeat protein
LSEGNIPGVDIDKEEAVTWWRRCVDYHRHIEATYELANAYYLGEGVNENPDVAVRLFWKAANLGHAGAAYMLGECLLEGAGTERDRGNALEWLVTAAELGHRLARSRVITVLNEEYDNLEAGRAREERKKEEAQKWMDPRIVNIERKFSMGGDPSVFAHRKTKVDESRGLSTSSSSSS